MTCTDSVATHILQHGELMTQCIFVDGGTKRTEVVVVADALELTGLAVELETMFGRVTDAADTEAGIVLVEDHRL